MTSERHLTTTEQERGLGLTKAGLDHTGAQLKLLEDFVKEVLVKDQDYGVIPGTNGKPSLLKPGAANITAAFNCHAEPLIDSQVLDPAGAFVSYEAHVDLVSNLSGNVMARGFGNCNSHEVKYRYRWDGKGAERKRVENTNPLEQANTIKKMAIKRAEVDAAMRLPGVARFFTQDLEDMAPRGVVHTQAASEEDVDDALAERDAAQRPATSGKRPSEPQAEQGTGAEPGAAPVETLTALRGAEALMANDFSVFWARCKAQGLDSPAVSKKLGMMPDQWLRAQPGRTLLEAVKALEARP